MRPKSGFSIAVTLPSFAHEDAEQDEDALGYSHDGDDDGDSHHASPNLSGHELDLRIRLCRQSLKP